MDIKSPDLSVIQKNDALRSILPMTRASQNPTDFSDIISETNENFRLTESKNSDNITANKFIFLKDDDEDG